MIFKIPSSRPPHSVIPFLIVILLSSCKVGRFVYYNTANITDYKIFPYRDLSKSIDPFYFKEIEKPNAPRYLNYANSGEIPFGDFLRKTKTVAFMIIRNDTIQYENYFNGYEKESIIASFSMAKSITSILIGCAIDDGFIKNEEEPITNYIPELKRNGFESVTIRHALQMTSGLKFNEGYLNPFGHVASFYYGRNLEKAIKKLKLKQEPGKEFEYVSGNTQLLGLVLQRALKGKTITDYLQEKIWSPLEMEYDASWSLDRKQNGMEKTFCCLNARARDFAKIGRLYLNKGNWNGKQLISEEWVTKSIMKDTTGGSAEYYQYQWWLPTQNGDFMAQGILGQYIYVNPDQNLIIVRLGKKGADVEWREIFVSLSELYGSLEKE